MRKRVNIDYTVSWANILTNGEPLSLVGRDIRLQLTNPQYRSVFVDVDIVNETTVQFKWRAAGQRLGKYSLTLWENYGTSGQSALDLIYFVDFVATTDEADPQAEGDLQLEPTIELSGGNIEVGVVGPSNYDLAVKHGYTGTEEEYLASLKGAPFTFQDFTPEEIAILQKPATEAAEEANKATKAAKDAAAQATTAAQNLPKVEIISEVNNINI